MADPKTKLPNPNPFISFTPENRKSTEVKPRTGFGKTIEANLGLRYDIPLQRLELSYQYKDVEEDPNYNAMDDLGDYSMFAQSLYFAKNEEHMAELKNIIDQSTRRRESQANASFGMNLAAGIIDPINFVALPLAGAGVVGSMGRVAVSTALVEGAVGAGQLIADPLMTKQEFAANVVSATVLSATFAGALSLPNAAIIKRTNEANNELFAATRRIENLGDMTPEQIQNALPRDQRPFASLSDAEINQKILEIEAMDDAEVSPMFDATPFKKELGLRGVEDLDINIDDAYNLKSSWFVKSPLFKMVSTPVKRILQAELPTRVKEITLQSFGDNGIVIALNSIGKATPQSAAIRAAVHAGQWVKASDSLLKIWATETNASPATRIDINLSDFSRRASRAKDTYREWLTNVSEKKLLGLEDMTEGERKAASVINKYFKQARENLEENGLINTTKGLKRQVEMIDAEIRMLLPQKSADDAPKTQSDFIIENRIDTLTKKKNLAEDKIRGLPDDPDLPIAPEDFFPRFYDKSVIKARRVEFEAILYKWFEENPYIYRSDDKLSGKLVRVELSTKPEDIKGRVDDTIRKILNENDPLKLENVYLGAGMPKHSKSRGLNIPNKLVTDFMMKDPLAVMKTYSARTDSRIEYTKMFGKDVEGVTVEIELEMLRNGKSEKEINRVLRDYKHMYSRTVGRVLDNPDSLSQKVATVMREAASFSYMGSSGIAAIPDFGRIVMEYEMDSVWKGIQAILDKERLNMTVDEVRMAGEAIDILKGSAHMRLMEDMSNNIDSSDLLSQTRNAFYLLNGLAPLTTLAKQLAGVIDAHQIIDYSIKLGKGQLDDQGVEWLASYGIGKEMAARIARAPYEKTEYGLYMANTEQWVDSIYLPEIEGQQIRLIEANEDGSPVGKTRGDRYIPAFYDNKTKTITFDRDYIEGRMFAEKSWLNPKVEGVDPLPDIFETPKQWSNFVMTHEVMHTRYSAKALGLSKGDTAGYENAINKLALEELKIQKTLKEEDVMQFRAALNSGVLNTIMSGTPADKPIITDGVVYIPMNVASKFGMKEDPRYKGYARIENGLMGLPFQFYSFVLANVNKTVGRMSQGQIKNRAIGSATMMGLAYMSLSLRTPDYIWEDMSPQDRFARSFDMSGIMALYSDLFYTAMHTSLALGGPNISAGFLEPKFNQEPSVADALLGFAGAGPSWTFDMAKGIADFASGDYGEGGKQVVRNLPFARLWFVKDEVNQITNAMTRR